LAAQIIYTISPASVAAGSYDFALTLNGANFSSDAVVEVNGEPLLTIASGSTTLKALVFSEDIPKPGGIRGSCAERQRRNRPIFEQSGLDGCEGPAAVQCNALLWRQMLSQ
jgi:hypothetical protein